MNKYPTAKKENTPQEKIKLSLDLEPRVASLFKKWRRENQGVKLGWMTNRALETYLAQYAGKREA